MRGISRYAASRNRTPPAHHSTLLVDMDNVLFAGPQRYGRTEDRLQHGVRCSYWKPPPLTNAAGTIHMICFNCVLQSCRVSTCPFTREKECIRKNFETWRRSKELKRSVASKHIADLAMADISAEEVSEVFSAKATMESDRLAPLVIK